VRYLQGLKEAAYGDPSSQEALRRLQDAREYVSKAPQESGEE